MQLTLKRQTHQIKPDRWYFTFYSKLKTRTFILRMITIIIMIWMVCECVSHSVWRMQRACVLINRPYKCSIHRKIASVNWLFECARTFVCVCVSISEVERTTAAAIASLPCVSLCNVLLINSQNQMVCLGITERFCVLRRASSRASSLWKTVNNNSLSKVNKAKILIRIMLDTPTHMHPWQSQLDQFHSFSFVSLLPLKCSCAHTQTFNTFKKSNWKESKERIETL